MASKSKTKGSTWEREIASHLSSLYNSSFLRTPTSGAFIGGQNKVRKEILQDGQIQNMKGDIIPPDSWKYFNCEAKNYAEFPFHQLFTSECKQLETWLSQLLEVADPLDMNILIFKITRRGKFIAVPQSSSWDTASPHCVYHSPHYQSWQIFDYTSFWDNNHLVVSNLAETGWK